jgi:uncharacterized protein (DUF58 family)
MSNSFFSSLFLTARLYLALGICIGMFVLSNFIEALLPLAWAGLGCLLLVMAVDWVALFGTQNTFWAARILPERFSNGDPNTIHVDLRSRYRFPVMVDVLDEVPFQFQQRDGSLKTPLPGKGEKRIDYTLRPVQRGEYAFGTLNIFVRSPLGLLQRRYRFDSDAKVPVFPSFVQMRKYGLMAVNNRLSEVGVKPIRRLGHSMEFEQIKEYVVGDDFRTMNWKASARTQKLMVNQFTEEKSQPVYCIIDKGRTMKMPFNGLSLLDHAINASLVISNIAIQRHDRAGIMTFADDFGIHLKASSRQAQMSLIQSALYKLQTRFLESDFEKLLIQAHRQIGQRSLLFLFTNFESLSSLRRQLPYLKKLSRMHLLVVVMFQNTELKHLTERDSSTLEEIYCKTIAEKIDYEKRLIVRELEINGIHALLSTPEDLTILGLNKYLEMKARGMI